jgi:hypothetical protein
LRKWQLQQLASVIDDVSKACEWNNPLVLSDMLEVRVMPWLDKLHSSLNLWYETLLADSRTARAKAQPVC